MDATALVGNTPLISLTRFWPRGNLYGKAECFNLTGSVKDRAASEILHDAQARGLLQPGGTVIEPTSGNMGISLAALCARMGYRCILVMPESMSAERLQLMRCFQAQVVLTPTGLGMQGAIDKAKQLAGQIPGSYLSGQFENPANVLAHYRTTGPEIWAQTDGRVDVLVAGVGTGGTLTGTGQYLKERNSKLRIIAVEPAESPLLSAGRSGSHGIQGIGANLVPPLLDRQLIHRVIPVTQAAAVHAMQQLAATEGLLCGISSGAALHAAAALAQQGLQVVAILPDSGQRYLSEKLF